jgi:hypothetical protein
VSTPAPNVPPSADLRANLAPVRDQGQRGTCLAFAVTAAHEAARRGAPPEDLSEEALFWGCKRIDGNWTGGTRFASAATALGRWGQPLETGWPYDPSRPDGVAYSPPVRPGAGWFRSGLRRGAVAPDEVRAVLDGGTPVLLGVVVYDTLFRPDPGGHIADPPFGAKPRGRHAILAVGHRAGELLIRNSWGTSWALGGYAWIGDTYIATHARDAWVIETTATTTVRVPGAAHAADSEGETYGTR